MRKFEVGDVVRMTTAWHGYPVGYVAEVVKLNDQGDPVTINMTGKDDAWLHEILADNSALISTKEGPVGASAGVGDRGARPTASGSLNSYYLSRVEFPQREDQPAYTAECEDLIESLRLNPDEANIFKEIWRSANARLGNGKPDHKALYGAEKINHYAGRNLRRVKREAQK